MPSESACGHCRKLHLKCDGLRPSCQQCVSASRDCPGYNHWRFINNGAKLPNKRSRRKRSRMASEQAAVPDVASTKIDLERRANAVTVTAEADQETESPDMPPPYLLSASSHGPNQTEADNAQHIDLQDAIAAFDPSPALFSEAHDGFDLCLASLASEFMFESGQEMAFLLRHYTDNLASWLDLFGERAFFQTRVPRLAADNHVLKYSVAALAAKHLSCVRGFRATTNGLRSRLALTEAYPSGQVDWAFKAANYYHQAVANSLLPPLCSGAIPPLYPVNTDAVAASSAILALHDMIDSHGDQYLEHLNCVKLQLSRYTDDGSASQSPLSPFMMHGDPAALAIFWHCMPHELLVAYDQKRPPILGHRGFPAQTQGLCENGTDHSTNRSPWVHLFRLMSRIIESFTATPGVGEANSIDGAEHSWQPLWEALNQWRAQLDSDFEPYSRYLLSSHLTSSRDSLEPVFDELLFATPLSAATLSYYHFSRVLLLLAKPVDQTNPRNQLKDYRQRLSDIADHCTSICGIAAGRPGSAARVHSVHPLFLAGQCLEGPRERSAVVQLLQDIEIDTGWPTAHLVSRLYEEWSSDSPSIST